MSTELEKCEQLARNLPLKDRAVLIKRLIDGLDELDEQDLERLWLLEANRRLQEFKAGSIQARKSDDVFRDARARLQEIR